jgi:hypothetical protein
MAKARRNGKTHPKPTGDDVRDDYMPPDRPDRSTGEDQGRSEVVDGFAGDSETVETGVDHNSAGEGDARAMASEGSGGSDHGESGSVLPDTRGTRQARGSARGDDGDGGAEGDDYSARVRKRIARERTLVNRERELRQQTQRELAEERAARQAQDERIARLERAQTTVAGNANVKELEAKVEALKPQLAAALEAGETARVLELQEKLTDLKAELRVLKYDLEQKAKQADTQGGQRQQATGKTEVIDNPEVAELATQFWRNNRHWANRSANKAAKDDAITIDREILADIKAGEVDFEPYSDEHFEELAKRLHETYPDLEIQDLDGQPYEFTDEDDMNDRQGSRDNRGSNRQRGPARGVAPLGRRGDNGRRGPTAVDLARQGKVQLDQSDFETMRRFKMDPNNATDKKYFAKEKMRSILSGQRQAGGSR